MGAASGLPALETSRGPGCLRSTVGLVALVVLGLPVAGVRALCRWRRGRQLRVTRAREALVLATGEVVARLDLTLDVPFSRQHEARDRLTAALVRVAEAAQPGGAVLHAVYRRAGDPQMQLAPVGPRLNDLGERCALLLSHQRLERRTVLWLALPAVVHLASVIDPEVDDLEAPGEPDAVVGRVAPAWAASSSFARGPGSLWLRLVLWVPEQVEPVVEDILDRLTSELGEGAAR